MQKIIPEIDVLISCALWLCKKGVLPLSCSIASGHGIETGADKRRLITSLEDAGYTTSTLQFRSDGTDITAISKSEFWQIECKGAGHGKQSTQRNNFDRALASAVSYYTDKPPQFTGDLSALNNAVPMLGLALPVTRDYLEQLKKRVRTPLRKRLNLWILLHDSITNTIIPISPEVQYPKSPSDLAARSTTQSNHFKNDMPARVIQPRSINTATQIEGTDRIQVPRRITNTTFRSNSGEALNQEWRVGARHALFHKDGTWFMPIERFPGAYFDPNGYVIFRTKQEYTENPNLRIGERVNVRGGLSRMPGYKRMR